MDSGCSRVARTLALCLGLLWLLPAARADGEHSWEFIDSEDGIRTWRRDIDGDMPAFRGETSIRGTIDDVLKPVLDWRHHTEWMYACRESILLRQLSPTRVLMYNRIAGMWPVWDRDVIMDTVMQWSADKGSLIIRATSVPSDLKPVPDRVVRMPRLIGVMKMWQVERNKVKVLYEAEADVGGRVPTWIAKLAARELPYRTLFALRERVEGVRRSANPERVSEPPH